MKKLSVVLGMLLSLTAGVAMSQCHMMSDEKGRHHEDKTESKPLNSKSEFKEQFYSTVYVCPMDQDVQSDKPGKCPKCGMKLEKKQVLMTYACPENNCDYRKAKSGICPFHKKDLVKCEIKTHCPKCGEQVDPECLLQKPVKPKEK